MSAAVGTALLNKEIRQALMSSLTKSANGSNRPNQAQTLVEGALAFVLLRSMKGSWIAQPAAISAIAALLVSLMKPKNEKDKPFDTAERVIDIDDYTIVD
jgi:hypothetical protein